MSTNQETNRLWVKLVMLWIIALGKLAAVVWIAVWLWSLRAKVNELERISTNAFPTLSYTVQTNGQHYTITMGLDKKEIIK